MKSAIYAILGFSTGLLKDTMLNFIKRLFGNTKIGVGEVTHAAPIVLAELKQIKESLVVLIDAIEDVLDENTDVDM